MLKSFFVKQLSIVLIFCLGILVYSNTFFFPFHFDDQRFIIDNFAIRNIQDLQGIWKFYPCRFLTFFSFAINYHFDKLHMLGYHVFNLGIHIASALLVWWLTLLTLSTSVMRINKITQHANLIALLAGLVFVSHPIQTEAVTYIWQRSASMAAMFYLASLCLYVQSRLQDNKFYYSCSLITAIAAMFTKENAITLPLMIVLYEFSFFEAKRINWRRLVPFLLTLFIIPLISLLIKSERLQEIQRIAQGPGGITPIHYFLTQIRVMVTYIRLIFLPFDQNLDYDYPLFNNILEMPVLISFLFLMTVMYCAKCLFSKYRLISFSIFWFFLTLFPESSFLPQNDIIFEHRLYLPLAGYSIFLVSSAYYLLGKISLKPMGIALVLVIICYSVLTYQRNKVWGDDMSLWKDVLRQSPHKARAYSSLGVAYIAQGNYTQAMLEFKKAVALDPNAKDVLSNRGASYLQQDNFIQALSDYNRAIAIDPENIKAYLGRAVTYCHLKEYDKAWNDVREIQVIGSVVEYEHIFQLVKEMEGVK